MGKIIVSRERADQMLEGNLVSKFEHLFRYEYAARKSGAKVLDLGCGFGYGAKMLFDSGREVTALDFSREAIEYAKRNYPGPRYLTATAEKLPFPDESFDSVISFEVIEHVQNAEIFLSEVRRVLMRGGRYFVSTPNPRHLVNIMRHYLLFKPWARKLDPNNIYHIREYPYYEFINLLKSNGFSVEERFGQILPLAKIKWVGHSKILSKILVLAGYFFPVFSFTVVVQARKAD